MVFLANEKHDSFAHLVHEDSRHRYHLHPAENLDQLVAKADEKNDDCVDALVQANQYHKYYGGRPKWAVQSLQLVVVGSLNYMPDPAHFADPDWQDSNC